MPAEAPWWLLCNRSGPATPAFGGELAQILAFSPAAPTLQTLQLGDATLQSAHWSESQTWGSERVDMVGSSNAPLGSSVGTETVDDSQARVILQACTSLVSLELAGFRALQGALLSETPASLQILSLRSCSAITCLPLPRCDSLVTVNLEQCYSLTDSAICALAAACPRLAELNCEGCEQMTDEAIATAIAAGGFQHLERLNLRACPNISAAGLGAIAAGCHKLACVVLGLQQGTLDSFRAPTTGDDEDVTRWLSDIDRWLAPVNDSDIATIVEHCPLSFIDLSACRVTGSVIEALSLCRINQCLQELRIVGCPHVGEVPSDCALRLPALGSLSVVSCPGFDDAVLASVLRASPNLQYLSIEDCAVSGGPRPPSPQPQEHAGRTSEADDSPLQLATCRGWVASDRTVLPGPALPVPLQMHAHHGRHLLSGLSFARRCSSRTERTPHDPGGPCAGCANAVALKFLRLSGDHPRLCPRGHLLMRGALGAPPSTPERTSLPPALTARPRTMLPILAFIRYDATPAHPQSAGAITIARCDRLQLLKVTPFPPHTTLKSEPLSTLALYASRRVDVGPSHCAMRPCTAVC